MSEGIDWSGVPVSVLQKEMTMLRNKYMHATLKRNNAIAAMRAIQKEADSRGSVVPTGDDK